MGFLNSNNFCRWLDIDNTPEFTNDGDFVATDAPSWNFADDAVIGNSDNAWTWDSSLSGIVKCDDVTQTYFDSKGISQELDIKKDKIYCIETELHNGRASDTNFYFYFTDGVKSQLVKQILVVNSTDPYRFYVKADNNYSKVMVVARNDNDMLLTDMYYLKVYEFNECFYALPLIKNDTISVFVNGELDSTSIPFAGLKIGMLVNYAMYIRDIASLNQIIISGTIYSVYADEWVIPVLPPGNIRFVLYDDTIESYDVIYFISNSFQRSISKDFTSVLKYKNAVDALGYQYTDAPTFYNKFRIDIRSGPVQNPENAKGYETYQGDFIKVKSDITRVKEFETRFLDEGAHEAFASMLSHSEILIDNIEYKKNQDSTYEVSYSEFDDTQIGNGIVTLLDADYSSAVKLC